LSAWFIIKEDDVSDPSFVQKIVFPDGFYFDEETLAQKENPPNICGMFVTYWLDNNWKDCYQNSKAF